jgi:hypothetical protein
MQPTAIEKGASRELVWMSWHGLGLRGVVIGSG